MDRDEHKAMEYFKYATDFFDVDSLLLKYELKQCFVAFFPSVGKYAMFTVDCLICWCLLVYMLCVD